MNRTDLLNLLEAALAAQQPAYARQAAQRYLADWPGDLAVQFALARALAAEGRAAPASELLTIILSTDPEAAPAHRALADQLNALGQTDPARDALAGAYVLDGQTPPASLPAWANGARAAIKAQAAGNWSVARREAQAAVAAAPDSPLVALIHLGILWHAGRLDAAQPLAESCHARWPRAVAFRLCLAECLLNLGEHTRGIALLHDAAAQDLGGQVVTRHWGQSHAYRALWDTSASAALPGPLPVELINVLGLNRLGGTTDPAAVKAAKNGQPASPAEEIAEIQSLLDRLAARLPSAVTVKHRLLGLKRAKSSSAPAARLAYIILSSRTRLTQQFGPHGFSRIDAALRRAAGDIQRRTGMQTAVLFVDDPASLSPFGLRPVNPTNAWDVKTLIARLTKRLQQDQAAIGALLIVGGGDIIPFHHLPNPTDDVDPDVPSDNPYATVDENYFVPEWPTARLPTGAGPDPSTLLRLIARLGGGARASSKSVSNWWDELRHWLHEQWNRRLRRASFGYSANVWRRASAAVFHQIGDPRDLLTSPPLDANALPLAGLAPSRLSYFNLHGIEDGPEWYGQRSFDDPGSVPEYPIALRPADVANSGRAPLVVFSEACYGANIAGKNSDDALCLKFLDSGSRVVVGSTKIAYGSVTTPLIGADLLGRCFWQNLTNGIPAGEALRRAKLQMAQEMHQRQGFLDGEDQKTLISFILYGDPLAVAPEPSLIAKRARTPIVLAKTPAAPPVICDKHVSAGPGHVASSELTPELVGQIKSAVAQYLPGMQDASIQVARAHHVCAGGDHQCPTHQLSRAGKAAAGKAPGRTVVTLSKTIRASAHSHPHFARVTFDSQGAVVKVAMSR